ncbi:MAG: S26 family signal peptidase, partial [Ruminococcus sp.]|nr:S26 family signal peptidase [Ruminococcus sp.]
YEDAVYPTKPDGAKIDFPYTTPDNCVFVLSDFRSNITDSRTYGGIPLDDVKGKVVFVMRRRGI